MQSFKNVLHRYRMSGALLALPFGLWLASCSHLPVQEFPSTANPADEITRLDQDAEQARTQQVNVLSPAYFQESQVSLEQAKKIRAAGGDNTKVLAKVAEGRAQLDKANKVALVARASLGDVVKARSEALAARADHFMTKEFKAADSDLDQVTRDVENDDLKSAEASKNKLKEQYLSLELAALKEDKLGSAQRTVKSAIKEGAEKDATRTLAVTEKALADADAFIISNRHDVAGIQSRADVATSQADRLLKITRDAKVTGSKDSEAIILEMEAAQKKAADSQALLAKKQVELHQEQGTVAALEAQKQGLKDDKVFNTRVDAIRSRFTANEAEVLKDGSQVLIRLKGLAFPTGNSMITEANFPLLGKVQQAVLDLGTGPVTINGHTDSRGAKAVNMKLSLDRANAVKAYLVASGKVPAGGITTAGFGDEKPLASNKTAAGRAQNRRVDVFIEPNRAAMSH